MSYIAHVLLGTAVRDFARHLPLWAFVVLALVAVMVLAAGRRAWRPSRGRRRR